MLNSRNKVEVRICVGEKVLLTLKKKNTLKQKTPVFSPNSRNYLVDESHIKKKREQKQRQAIEAARVFSGEISFHKKNKEMKLQQPPSKQTGPVA